MGVCQDTGSADFKVMAVDGASPHDFSGGAADRYFPVSSTLKSITNLNTRDVMRGTPTLDKDDMNEGVIDVLGEITLQPGFGELTKWLGYVMGSTAAGSPAGSDTHSFASDGSLAQFGLAQKIGAIEERYDNCVCSQLVITGEERGQLTMVASIIGKGKADYGGLFLTHWAAANTITGAAARAIQYSGGSFVVNSTQFDPVSFELIINNNLTSQFRMNTTAQCIERSADREVILNVNLPKDSTHDTFYGQGNSGLSGSLEFSTVDMDLNFNFGALKWNDMLPDISGKDRIQYDLSMRALGDIDGAVAELEIVTDYTPA